MNVIKDKKKRDIEIDLLSIPKTTQRWVPQFLRRRGCWKVFSGKWKLESPNRVIYLREPKVKTGENISIIGSDNWKDLIFHARFKVLTDSTKPPKGGTILYFLFKDIRNYYSIHFCHFKQKIEFIKRFQGIWSTIAEKAYDFEIQKDYRIAISTCSGIHRCQIDGTNLIESRDTDIIKGCVGIGVKYCNVEFSQVSISIP